MEETSKVVKPWAGDIWGGLAAMLVALPSAIAFGVAIYSPLGAGYAAQGAIAGILGTAALGLIASSFGGTDRLITAPCAPAAAVLAAVAIGFVQSGASAEASILMLVLIALLAGAFQIGLGIAGIGRLIKFIPYPVVSGYLSGVGLIIIGSQLPRVLGAPKAMGLWEALQHPDTWRMESILIGLAVIVSMVMVPRIIRAVPAAIIAMLVGVLVYFALAFVYPALWDSHNNPLIVGPLSGSDSNLLDAVIQHIKSVSAWDSALLPQIFLPALTLAVLLSIDTLKTCVVLDALTSTHHNPNRELIGQGLGNIGSALLGGIPGAGQMGASMVNLSSGANTRRSGVIEGAFSLIAFLLLASLVAWVPIAALGGILLVVGYRMIDQHSLAFFRSEATRFDFFVILAVIITALTVSLIAASGIGILLAAVLYLREQARSSVLRGKVEGSEMFSKVVRHEQELSILIQNGGKTVIVELQGSLFFGTANQLFLALEPEIGPRTYVILNMRRVQSIDLTATHVLEQIKDRLESVGAYLIFTEIPRGLPSGLKMKRYLRQVGLVRDTTKALAFRQLDEALEWVETQLLKEDRYVNEDNGPPLELAELETLLAWKTGTLTNLEAILEQRHIRAGKKVFKIGTPGDELLFIRRGTVRVEFPITKKETWHIGTFGRGDFIGEMGFLDSTRRSAEAVAMTDTECFVLSRIRFNEIASQQTTAASHIFEGIASVLAMRLRFMNKELRALRT